MSAPVCLLPETVAAVDALTRAVVAAWFEGRESAKWVQGEVSEEDLQSAKDLACERQVAAQNAIYAAVEAVTA